MESGFHYVSQPPSIFSVALRALGGLVGGTLAAAVVILGIARLLALVALPAFSSVGLGILGTALGFVIGGAVARGLAGPRPSRGFMGVVFAFALVALLYLLPERDWAWLSQHGLTRAASLEGLVVQGRAELAREYTLLIRVLVVVAGTALGCLGDLCIMRGRRPRGRQRPLLGAQRSSENTAG